MTASAPRAWQIALPTRLLTGLVAALALAAACQELDVSAVDVDQVSVQPDIATVPAGQTRQLTARVTDANGRELRDRTVSWSSDNPGVAQVSATGEVLGMSPGEARITASTEGHSGQASITVTSGGVARVDVSPNPVSIQPGESVQLEATARAGDGSVIAGVAVAWASEDQNVATVNPAGRATGVAVGTTRITATAAGHTGAADVTVGSDAVATVEVVPGSASVAEGETFQLQALVKSAGGAVLVGRTVTWNSSDGAIATVDGSGLVRGVSTGQVRITASAEGRSGESLVTVTPRTVASVTVSPSSSSVAVGATVQLEAVARSADGSVVAGRTFTWTTDDAGIATVNDEGLVSGVAVGTATITATADGQSGTARVLVTNVPIATIEIQPPGGDISLGDSLDITAIARDVTGAVLQNRAIIFTSSNSGVATVAPTGSGAARIRAVALGETTISAAAEGISVAATFRVVAKPVANVAVTPGSANVIIDATVQLSATLTAADGTVLTGRPIAWSSNASGIASVDGNGLVRGVAAGIAIITATSEGRTGQATITVGLKPVDKVEVLPAADTLDRAETVQLTAVLTAADGSTLTGRPVSWSSSNQSVAQVNGNGLVTAAGPGSANITATSEGKSGQAQIVVRQPAVASIEVQPSAATLMPPATQSYQAIVRAVDGSSVTNRPVSWRSSNNAVATVAAGGGVGLTATATPAAQPSCTGESCATTIEATADGVTGSATLTVLKPIASIELAPTTLTLAPGASATITPTVKAADGTVLAGRTLNWSASSANAAVPATAPSAQAVSVSAASTLNCTGQSCTVTITAAAEGRSATATVTIPKPVAAVQVTPATLTIDEGEASSVAAVVTAADNTVLTGRPVTWTTTNGTIATVSASGASGLQATVTGGACPTGSPTCSATIRATAEGVAGTVAVTVQKTVANVAVTPSLVLLPQGATVSLAAEVTSADGTKLTNRRVQWTSNPTSVATVAGTGPNDQNATVTGVGLGLATITARTGGRSGTAAVTVIEPIASIELTPTTADLAEGATTSVTAVVRGVLGTILTNRAVTWTSTNNAIASVTGKGQYLLEADVKAGACPQGSPTCTATITAAAEGKSATLAVTVRKQVASVNVSPDPPPDLVPGQNLQLTAVPRASDGTNLSSVAPVAWSSSAAAIASVTAGGGLVSAVSAGCAVGQTACTATITASAGGRSQDVVVRVLKLATQVQISPDPVQDLLPGQTVQLTAILTAADGTDLTGARPVTWASTAAATAQVDGNGLVTATGPACAVGEPLCVARVSASADNVTADVQVRVLKPVDTIVISPDPGVVQQGQALTVSTQLSAADGTNLVGRTITWTTEPGSPPGGVTLSSTTGTSVTVTGTAVGNVVLKATSEGKTAQITITITP